MSYATAFPTFDAATLPVIPSHWEDRSWKNEACPFWQINQQMGVYVDFAAAEDREFPEMERYTVVPLLDGCHCDGDHILATDDWREVLGTVYKSIIGYDPFEDDPTISEQEVADTLAEYHQIDTQERASA